MRQCTSLAALTLLLAAAPSAQACGACGCTLHSDWATQGYATGPGFRFDLRYDYFNQDQLRSGTKSVDRNSFEIPNEQEIQEKTLNRNLTATLDYSPNADWGVTLLVPVFNRYHATNVRVEREGRSHHPEAMLPRIVLPIQG